MEALIQITPPSTTMKERLRRSAEARTEEITVKATSQSAQQKGPHLQPGAPDADRHLLPAKIQAERDRAECWDMISI